MHICILSSFLNHLILSASGISESESLIHSSTSFLMNINASKNFLIEASSSNETAKTTEVPTNLTKCFSPRSQSTYIPRRNFCIYGIKYNADSFDLKNVLYFNDPFYQWDLSDITLDEFEKATLPLCKHFDNYGNTYTSPNVSYYGTWVLTKEQKYEDMFILCCKFCPTAKTETQWRIILKLQFMLHNTYNLVKDYQLQLFTVNDLNYVYYDERFYTTGRIEGQNNNINTCIGENMKRIPTISDKNVCFVTGSSPFSHKSLHERKEFINHKIEAKVHFGIYSATKMRFMKHLRCKIPQSFQEDDECIIWMTADEYGYECCCYGDTAGDCQDRILNTITTGNKTSKLDSDLIMCANQAVNDSSLNFTNDSVTGKLTLQGKMLNLLNSLSNKGFCPLLLQISGEQHKYYLSEKEIGLNAKVALADICQKLFKRDFRFNDITQTRCVQLQPTVCPFNITATNSDFTLLCCCDDHSFCNYNVPLLNRFVSKKSPYCKYNYYSQLFINEFYLIAGHSKTSCLLHYIDNSTLLDMHPRLPKQNSILFYQPGNALIPIDYSYALLRDNSCRYIDVNINSDFIHENSCNESSLFNTEYLPLRIFACRCWTRKLHLPCDESLKIIIGHVARIISKESSVQCLEYQQQKFIDLAHLKKEIVSATHTSYCYTEITLKINENVEFYASGGVTNRTIVNQLQKYLDHIAYAMWQQSGSRTSLCSFYSHRTAYCFCRWYNYSTIPCNDDIREPMKAIEMLMHQEFIHRTRTEHKNVLSRYLEKTDGWCHLPGFYSTIDIDLENENVTTHGRCIHTKTQGIYESNEDRAFCEEIIALNESCISKIVDEAEYEDYLLCCCINECETTVFTTQVLAKNIKDRMHFKLYIISTNI